MLILTEKSGVAKDFARALGCNYSSADKCYKNADGSVFITNCVGHLFELEEPTHYGPEYKSWKKLPVLPEHFDYRISKELKDAASVVIRLLKKHKKDEILIATDADREGEIIARECLNEAGISDFSKIKRFWVSQALTPDVIRDGISKAKPLGLYTKLSDQGFARQHSDWIVGMNATRFITNKAGTVFPVGRVQTAVLSAISERCKKIDTFKSEKYYEVYGEFGPTHYGSIKGLYKNNDGKSKFKDASITDKLPVSIGTRAIIVDSKSEQKTVYPPLLYSLNDLEKDAYKYFGFSAEKTLKLVQKLYEEYKCVSYPRTPSKVMGSQNVELCREIYQKLLSSYVEYFELHSTAVIDGNNKRIFNDEKLEAHHALIPLAKLPVNATGDEDNIYSLILERFMLAFASASKYEKKTVVLDVNGSLFTVEGRKVLDEGWKKYRKFTKKKEEENEDDFQNLDDVDFNNLTFTGAKIEEKMTKPPKHFNEASILSFMENPKDEEKEAKRVGLGTPATRHTFIPKLMKSKYIEVKNGNILITKNGEKVLYLLESSSLKNLTDVGETTRWEEQLQENPAVFEKSIREFISSAVSSAAKEGRV